MYFSENYYSQKTTFALSVENENKDFQSIDWFLYDSINKSFLDKVLK